MKPAYGSPIDNETMTATIGIFERLMNLLHPFMPFVTEEVWHTLRERPAGTTIMMNHYPHSVFYDQRTLTAFDTIRDIIAGVRNIRNSRNIAPKEKLNLTILGAGNELKSFDGIVSKLANLDTLTHGDKKIEGAVSFMVGTIECYVPLQDNVDKESELKKLQEELKYAEGFLASVMKKLSNPKFVNGAPANVVETERKKQHDAETKIATLNAQIAALK